MINLARCSQIVICVRNLTLSEENLTGPSFLPSNDPFDFQKDENIWLIQSFIWCYTRTIDVNQESVKPGELYFLHQNATYLTCEADRQ